ncbi:hypothetical protein SODALDRAFT_377383 [Sodiomyces alkalinus F11]|uniref:Mediator of RNA polymerase II transcription subunit 12 n=1 Tax=Sodiomyces alkalinus (strain CBS 110278 / VKM F-3762 / F11) TaxID=1314773 RepID=A0A3N2Q4U6_SODAK|nr:hypothetical protein SODALDRAFT_377383 [Sodiomyces alkalinus F11]ROT41726.1 hypothetical protein SODALDRAFT_377383 [Sodiomyces alkalinus F11]
MTSRTPMGVQPRPPQRTLSSSGLTVQRPTQQRALSAQYLPQSPARKDNFIDLTTDANDAAVAQNRYGTAPRRGGSRLKLELSSNNALATSSQPILAESPQSLTPSRSLSVRNDSSSLTDMNSPASSKSQPIDIENLPMPMPKRRPRFVVPAAPQVPPTTTAATAPTPKKDARPKPYTMEVPPAAPRYLSLHRPKSDATKAAYGGGLSATKDTREGGAADFFPWKGNHPEDRLSDSVIKQGYFDKAPVSQAETTSAKSAIFPALKNKNGLNLLSSIFVHVMNQRKYNGQITTPSTFKPPPRVTLTDTKREIWMRDLANPAISLRRLSRTIPHGIRGKGLLDHCLNKKVPTERAVWLVRCVGANDLRTVKRKGVNGAVVTGGEMKWLRDWTFFVEQFVESVVAAFGDPDWKAKVQYAIRLATHLYAEHLVDQDHYMDWLVSGLENSTHARLPMWILITQIYWKDLLQLRKYGRRLATALLNHLNTIHNDPDRDILASLSTKLSSLVIPLISSYPHNFLSPAAWLKCRDVLFASLPIDSDAAQTAYKNLNLRNERLVASTSKSEPAKRQILIKHLDSTYHSFHAPELAATCWAVGEDKAMVVRTVLEWSTSFHRPGLAKVYVAANLLRTWAALDLDVTSSVLDFLDTAPPQASCSKRLFYQLVGELVRSSVFNVHRYVVWTMTRGILRQASDTEPDASCPSRLLVDLPLHALNSQSRRTRADLLRRAGYDVAGEADDIGAALKHIQHAIGIPLDPQDPLAQRKPLALGKICRAVSNSSRALQAEVGARMAQLSSSNHVSFHMSLAAFNAIRSILEAAQDFAMLATVVKSTIGRASDPDLLASCADTVNLHLPVFLALGVARDLCDLLVGKMRLLASDDHAIPPRVILMSLVNLTARIPGFSSTAVQLRQELQQRDRGIAIDACSPVSDTTAAARLQDSEGELHDEIEKLLSSGTSVDRPTMDRLFHTVVSRLERCWGKDVDKTRAYSTLLARLRVFDPSHFDVRMTDWVHHVSTLRSRPVLADIYPFLISLGCLSFSILITTTSVDANKLVGSTARQTGCTSTYMQEALLLAMNPLSPKAPMTPEEAYRFYIQQGAVPQQHPKEVTVLVRNALIEYSLLLQPNAETSSQRLLADPKVQDRLLDLLRLLVLSDSPATAQILGAKVADAPHSSLLANITTRLLAGGQDPDAPMSFETVLEMANDFSLPFCQLKLSIGLTSNKATGGNGENQAPSRIDMLSKALDQAVDTKNMMWTSVLPYLSEEITEHLRRQAQARFLSLFPSPRTPSSSDTAPTSTSGPDVLSTETVRLSESFLSVVESIIRGRPALRVSLLNHPMVEKLTELWELLFTGGENRELRAAILCHWLPALVKFIALHTATNESAPAANSTAASNAANNANTVKPPTTAPASDVRARMVVALAGVTLELDNLSAEEDPKTEGLRESVLDLALVLVDNLPEEGRQKCIRAVLTGGSLQSPVTSDARLRYLFSYTRRWMEQFVLAHRLPSSGGGTGTTQVATRPKVPISLQGSEKLTPYVFRRWEMLSEPTPIVGENDTALSLSLFEAIKLQ